jgi:hypothetical protein
MNVENAAVFLANSILIGAGFCIVFIVIIFINNLIHKYWKPVRIFSADSWHINPPPNFVTDEELQRMKDRDPPMDGPVVQKGQK